MMSSGSDLIPTPVPEPKPSPAERVLPEHREQTVETLTLHFANDRLTMDEFEHRTAAVYAARTLADVQATLEGLPDVPAGTLEGTVVLDEHPTTASGPQHQQLTVILSNHERRGTLVIPAKLRIKNILGNVELDLRHATFTSAVTEIDISALLGNVEITLPAGVLVESLGHAMLGTFETGAEQQETLSGTSAVVAADGVVPTLVRLTGKSVLGAVSVWSRGSQRAVTIRET